MDSPRERLDSCGFSLYLVALGPHPLCFLSCSPNSFGLLTPPLLFCPPKVTRNHPTRTHAGYGFFDCVSEEAAKRIMENLNGMPIPGSTRIWRLNLGKEGPQKSGIEANVYVGDVAPGVTDYDLMQLFKAK